MTNTNNTSKKNRVDFKDIQITAILNGVDAVRKMYDEKPFTKATLEKAVNSLPDAELADALRSEFHDMFKSAGGRGRKAATLGDHRQFTVQQVKDGDLFVRLPVRLLSDNLAKGDKVVVQFSADGILVRL